MATKKIIPATKPAAKQNYERIACVFQGGGALGAYQVGAFKALHEHGYHPNFLAGVSIGAINAAIVAGNSPDKQIERLEEFWKTITPSAWSDYLYHFADIDMIHHFHNRMGATNSLLFGQTGFFEPRLTNPNLLEGATPDQLSYYDTSPLRETLTRLIDFDRINSREVTLSLGAVNITKGELVYFNNQETKITVDHVMASGALPPAFPAVKIGDDYFWDGGIYGNTPLLAVLDALPLADTLCFMIDCFNLKGPLPTTMDQIEERQKDIKYGSHSRRNTSLHNTRQNLQAAIAFLGEKLSPEAKKDPDVKRILELGNEKKFSLVHIIYQSTGFSHSFKDYNFARAIVLRRFKHGYRDACAVLENPQWEKESHTTLADSIYGLPDSYYQKNR